MAESLAELKADRILAEARREARAIIDAARVDARREARGIVDAARVEAEGIITEAFEERARIVRRDWAIGDFTTTTDEVAEPDATEVGHLSNGDDAATEITAGSASGEVADVPAATEPDDGPAPFERRTDESVAARAAALVSAEIEGEVSHRLDDEPDGRPPAAPTDRTVPVPARAASRGGGSTSALGELIESPGIVEPFRRPLRRADAPAARDAGPATPPRVWPARLPRPGETVPAPGATPQPPPPPPARLPSRLSSQSSTWPPAPARPGPGDRRIPETPPTPASPPPRLSSRLSRTEASRPAPPGVPRLHPESEPPPDRSNEPDPPDPPGPPDSTSPESQVVARRRVERELPAGMRIPPDVPDWDDPFEDPFDDDEPD